MSPGALVFLAVFGRRASPADKIVAGARAQLVSPAFYDPAYTRIAYPNGDLPLNRGVCTDVVIRALRNAGYDMQRLIHEDMKKHFLAYPRREGRPDSNIDHRRVPNLVHYFSKHGLRLTTKVNRETLTDWRPGDLVFWKLPNGRDHCGVLSNRCNASGVPLVIHNISRTAEEDVLQTWTIVEHYRFPKG